MKINMSQVLKGYDGESIYLKPDKKGDPLTLADVCCEALMAVLPDEQNIPGSEKLIRHVLATRIYGANGEGDFTVENVALLKNLVGKTYGPRVVGPAWIILDGS